VKFFCRWILNKLCLDKCILWSRRTRVSKSALKNSTRFPIRARGTKRPEDIEVCWWLSISLNNMHWVEEAYQLALVGQRITYTLDGTQSREHLLKDTRISRDRYSPMRNSFHRIAGLQTTNQNLSRRRGNGKEAEAPAQGELRGRNMSKSSK